MPAASHHFVRDAPSKPLLVFDGDCHFCRRWIERWRDLTGEAVEYAPFQEAADRFPEIPREAFERALQFIETDGTVSSGAEAVFRSLSHKRSRRWMARCYERVPGFAALTEAAYRLVAQNRRVASFFTRLLWGGEVRRPSYTESSRWFFRALGGIYLIAFLSLWMQIDGLVGEHGILPVTEYLRAAREYLGSDARWILPTLCWLNPSNAFLHFLCGAGAIVSVVLMAGFLRVTSLVLLFVAYLSLTIAGQTFLNFQWDILLLETGFLALFLGPWRWRPRFPFWPASPTRRQDAELQVSRVGHFLLKLLLFKLILMSGVVKLTSGDDSWWNLTALDYHYWTQPLPTVFGWWAHQGPEWLRHFSTFFVLFVECVVPFFIWAPRRLRHLACVLLVSLQVLIALTGNYCFFNLLTIALCLLLIDDAVWRSKRGDRVVRSPQSARALPQRLAIAATWAVLVTTIPLNGWLIYSAFKPDAEVPRPITRLYEWLGPFRIANGYGLFRVMTKSRPEITIEGSADGVDWLPYEFTWKPGDLNQFPRWVAPHQPRLDWQMWFAALGNYRQNPWFVQLALRLLKNDSEVTRLLARNPFPENPPRYIRARLYDYRFASLDEHKATGAWWKREERGEYLPPISLRQAPAN